MDAGLETGLRTDQEDVDRMGDAKRRRQYVSRIYCALDIWVLLRLCNWCFADRLQCCIDASLESLPTVTLAYVHFSVPFFRRSIPLHRGVGILVSRGHSGGD